MADVIVVGSGASGVHFALSLLKKGHEVTGRQRYGDSSCCVAHSFCLRISFLDIVPMLP